MGFIAHLPGTPIDFYPKGHLCPKGHPAIGSSVVPVLEASWPPPTWAACGRWKSTACSSRAPANRPRPLPPRGGRWHDRPMVLSSPLQTFGYGSKFNRGFGLVNGCGSKPMGSHFWGGCTTHFSLVGVGMFTEGTIWLLTHGQLGKMPR